MEEDKVRMKRYVETRFDTIIKRTDFFYNEEVTPKAAGAYLNQLNADKDTMKKSFNAIDSPFNLNKEYIDGFLRAFDNEIELAEFYLELHKAKKNPNFDKWVYLTEEEANKEIEDDWRKKSGNVWERSNGRVKAIIRIKDNTTSTKVSLTIENDSKMTFIERDKGIDSSNLRNEESIKKKIEEYKTDAEKTLSNTIFPRYHYEKRQFDNLKRLLHCEVDEDV